MSFRKFVALLFALVVCLATQAQAQLGLYGTYTANHLSGMTCFDPQGKCSSANGALNLTGGWGGVFYDFRNVGPVRLGLDVRAGEGHSNKSATSYGGGADATASQNVLAGVRASFHTPISAIKPYAQISAGWGRSNVTEPLGTPTPGVSSPIPPRLYDHFLEVEGFAGVDLKIFPVLDIRLIELGLGDMHRLGSGSGTSSVGLRSAGIGIVFHLPAS